MWSDREASCKGQLQDTCNLTSSQQAAKPRKESTEKKRWGGSNKHFAEMCFWLR